MNDDLISRQAAIDEFYKYPNVTWTTLDVLKHISELPSTQPEIVRCKDCLMHGVCRFEQGLGLDGYCSQAERRTDEAD